MMPTGTRVGLPTAAVRVCERSSAIEVADNDTFEEEAIGLVSGTAGTEVGFATPAESVTTGCATGGVVDGDDGGGGGDGDNGDGGAITAVLAVSELVGAILAGGTVGAAAMFEDRTTVLLGCEGAIGLKFSGADADG